MVVTRSSQMNIIRCSVQVVVAPVIFTRDIMQRHPALMRRVWVAVTLETSHREFDLSPMIKLTVCSEFDFV